MCTPAGVRRQIGLSCKMILWAIERRYDTGILRYSLPLHHVQGVIISSVIPLFFTSTFNLPVAALLCNEASKAFLSFMY
ncbi:hypothetical protein BDR06DRAFT_958420 [Suillus hirtellus]|nr:hypothetical protein BDR06DRAFT_958420 [Suillus hirtellus]